MRLLFSLLLFLSAAVAAADPVTVAPGQFADLKYKLEAGDKIQVTITPAPVQRADVADPGRLIFAGKAGQVYTVRGFIVNFKAERLVPVDDTVTFGGKAPPTPPDPDVKPRPPAPKPKPVDPPVPVASFKVVMVYESGAGHTAAQKAVLEGKVVEEWLTANCSGGKLGWQRRDKDSDPSTDTTSLKGLWAAVKTDLDSRPAQKYPCVAVAVNENVEIVLLEATPAAMVKVLDKYRTGGK